MSGVTRPLNGLVRLGEAAGAIAIAVIAAIVLYDVTVRALGYPTLWALEFTAYVMVGASVLAAGEVLHKGGHFEVRLFVDLLPPRVQRIVDLAVALLSALFVIAVTFGIFQLLVQTWQFGFRSPTLYRVPLIIPQSVLAIGFVLLSLAYLAKVIGEIRRLCASEDAGAVR
jgi:TRAP-type C4-dicarboxylate transport system permease small subunit